MVAGECSLERDGTGFHLHFQMVIRIQARSVLAVSKFVKRYLGWVVASSSGAVVMCRALNNKGLHTLIGILGYHMKDVDASHFQTTDHNVTTDDIAIGAKFFNAVRW